MPSKVESPKAQAATVSTVEKQSNLKPWKPGESGNPKGRAKGSRNHLSQAFIDGLCVAYDREGQAAIDRVLKDDPRSFLKLVAQLVPQKIESTLQVSHLSEEFERAASFADAWRVASRARELIGASELPEIEVLNDDD
jgi:hypothetical protein